MIKIFLYSFLLYLILLAFFGYPYGEDGHTEVLPYLKYELNNNLYRNDFFMQSITSGSINERYFFVKSLTLYKNNLSYCIFFSHFLISIATFLGLYKIAHRYITDKNLILLLLLTLFLPFSYFSFGSNFLYNNDFVSGSLSSTIGVWALFFFLEKKYVFFTLLSAIATFIHPIVGTQLFLLCTGTYFFLNYKTLAFHKDKTFIISVLIYFFIVSFPLYSLLKYFMNGNISNQEVYDLVAFRLPHHFIPSLFHWRNYVILVPLTAFSTYFFYSKDRVIFAFLSTSMVAILIYIFCADVLRSPILFFSQWPRASVWIIPFLLISIFSWIEINCTKLHKKIAKIIQYTPFLFVLLAVFSLYIVSNPLKFGNTKHYNLPFLAYKSTPSIAISIAAKDKISENALFVQPIELNLLKFFGEKSSYVNMVAFPNSKLFYKEWRRRIENVYNVRPNEFKNYAAMAKQADNNFYALRENDFYVLQKEGVTHILTKNTHLLSFPKILENSEFIIYKIEFAK
jgi:hypothetical protein